MKNRNRIFLLALFISANMAIAQNPFTEFKLGVFAPSGVESGIFFGVNTGRMIDEAVSFSVAVDMYTNSSTQESEIFQGEEPTIVTEIENSTYYFPVLVKLNYERNLQSGMVIRGSAGIGYSFMWVNENNYLENINQTRYYSGLAWRMAGGIGIQISSSSNLFVDLAYNSSKVSRDKGENAQGLPTRTEIDMSGFSFRIGVSIFNLGF